MEIPATITLLPRKPRPAVNAMNFAPVWRDSRQKRMAEDFAIREQAEYERLKAKYDPPAVAQAGK